MVNETSLKIEISTTEMYEMYLEVMNELDAEWNDDSCVTNRNIVRILCYSAVHHVSITNAALSLGLAHPFLGDDDYE